MDHEAEFIRRFVIRQKRRRYLSFLATRKNRRKLTEDLNHFKHLDPRYARLLPPNAQTASGIETILKAGGAPERCHVISSSAHIDAREMPLTEALLETVGYGSGTILSCIPGKLAYFEGEEQKERYILERSDDE